MQPSKKGRSAGQALWPAGQALWPAAKVFGQKTRRVALMQLQVFAKLDSRTVKKQNQRLNATAIKYNNELKFVYGRVRIRLGRPYT